MLAMDLLHRLRVATWVAKQMAVDCMNARPGIEVASVSDVGCLRDNNEDSYLYWSLPTTVNSSERADWR